MTHNKLVQRAAKWLKNSLHCRVVLTEHVAYTRSRETPDAIGWVNNRAVLIECKTSRADFYADRKKPSRHQNFPALGVWRFYLTIPGILTPMDIELIGGWGVYEIYGRRILHKGGNKYNNAGKPPFESDKDSEVALLVSALAKKHNKQPNKPENKQADS